MKCKKAIIVFVVILFAGINPFVYANEPNAKPIQNERAQESLAELYHKAGLDSPEVIVNTLINLGISQEELQQAVGQGKKIYDLLQEKEITLAKFKKALTEEYKSTIKQAKKMKVITRKEAKVLTDLLKQRMDKWDV